MTVPGVKRPRFVLRRAPLCALAGVLALVACMFLIRLAGPWKLMDLDQERPVQYAMDIVLHDRWIVQTDSTGDIASKPPVYPWLIAIVAHARGGVDRVSVYLPTAGAIAGSAALILVLTRSVLGLWPGFLAALAFACSTYAFKMVHLARTDPLFAMFVALGAACAWRAWNSTARSRWIVAFWLFATLATMTKGPLGVVLAALGCLAILFERRAPTHAPGERASEALEPHDHGSRFPRELLAHAVGIAMLVVVAGGWLLWAHAIEGRPVLDKLLGRELLGHAVRSERGDPPLVGFWKTWVYFITRYLPWSVPALIACAFVVLRPARDLRERRFERFCACWLLGGLAMFCVFPHQRPDLLLPLIPPAAILAGRALAAWTRSLGSRGRTILVGAIVAIALAGGATTYLVLEPRGRSAPVGDDPTRYDKIVRTREIRELAARIDALDVPPGLLHFSAGPRALQIFLGVKEPFVDAEKSRELLASQSPAWVVGDVPIEGARVVLDHVGVRGERLVLLTNR